MGKACQKVYEKHGIIHYTAIDPQIKASICERKIRSIKAQLFKRLQVSEDKETWVTHLADIMETLNKTKNRITKMSPNEMELPKNQFKVFNLLIHRPEMRRLIKLYARNQKEFKFNTGQLVRISLYKTGFEKSATGGYSDILYVITSRKISPGGVPVYKLKELITKESLTGRFYEQELMPVSIDQSQLPKIDKIHKIRYEPRGVNEEVLVTYSNDPGKKTWLKYDDLIPYKDDLIIIR